MFRIKLKYIPVLLISLSYLFASCDSQDKKDASDFFLKGNTAFTQNNYAEAVRLYDEAIAKNAEFSDAYLNKGISLMKLNRPKDAYEVLSEAIRIDPTFVQAILARAEVALVLGDLSAVEAGLKEIQKKYQDSTRYYLIHGDLMVERGQNSIALADYDKALQLSPTNTEAWVNRGALYYNQRQYDLARNDFSEAVKLDPYRAEAINNLGLIATKERNWTQALAYFDRVLARNPSHALSLNNKAFVLLENNKAAEARELIERSLELLPENGYALRNLGLYYMQTGSTEKAIQYYEKAIELAQPVENLYGFTGQAYLKNSQKQQACAVWSKGKLLSDSLATIKYQSECL